MAELMNRTRSPATVNLWFVLFALADGRSGKLPAKVSARHLAKLTGLARSSVLRSLDHLVEHGLIDLTRTPRGMTCTVKHHRKGEK
jgi:hypothetical protein